MRKVRDWHNEHPYSTVPEGINPVTGKSLSKIGSGNDCRFRHAERVHEKADERFTQSADGRTSRGQILDKYTVGKVAFTLKGYQAIVPDMTEEETAFVLEQLKLAREQAIDYKNMETDMCHL